MATFMISQTTANMEGCSNVWPTNRVLFAVARDKMPQHAQQLDDLLLQAEEGMTHKVALENMMGAWYSSQGMAYVHSDKWPTDFSAFLLVIGESTPSQKEDLFNLWELVYKALCTKRKLDSSIVQILGGTFTGDAYDVETQADPWDAMTEEEKADYTSKCEEDDAKQPWCNYCHPDSACDGDHGDEMRTGFLLRKGPAISPITVPKVEDAWTEEDYLENCSPQNHGYELLCPSCNYVNRTRTSMCLMCSHMPLPSQEGEEQQEEQQEEQEEEEQQEQEEQQQQPNCGHSGGCAWPEFCRCGWQYNPLHGVQEFRDGTAKWDANTEIWTWTSKYTDAMIPVGTHYVKQKHMHFPYQEEEDIWARDLERIVAESKAIREAPLSTFLPSFLIDDDDHEVDIEAA